MTAPAQDPTPGPPFAADTATAPHTPRNVLVLGWASLVNDIASEMLYPLLPEYVTKVLHGTKTDLGLIEGAAESASSLLKLVAGWWSDRVRSRKRFIVVGYLLTALARPLQALALLPLHMLALRLADRTGKGIRTAPRDALIADSTPESLRGRAFGFQRAMDHLGAAIGPLLGLATLWLVFHGAPTAADATAWRWLFACSLIPGVCLVVLVAVGLRETPHQADPTAEKSPEATRSPLGHPLAWFLLTMFVFTLGNSSDAFLLQRAEDLGLGLQGRYLLWSGFHILKSSGSLVSGRIIDRFGARPTLVASWLVYALTYCGFALAATAWHVWALFALYAAFYALSEPAEKTLVAALVGPEQRGRAYGWFHAVVGVAAFPASVVFGSVYDRFGGWTSFGYAAILALLAAGMLFVIPQKRPLV